MNDLTTSHAAYIAAIGCIDWQHPQVTSTVKEVYENLPDTSSDFDQ